MIVKIGKNGHCEVLYNTYETYEKTKDWLIADPSHSKEFSVVNSGNICQIEIVEITHLVYNLR